MRSSAKFLLCYSSPKKLIEKMLVLQCLFIVSIGCESNQRDTSMDVLRGSSRTISVSVAYARQPAEPA